MKPHLLFSILLLAMSSGLSTAGIAKPHGQETMPQYFDAGNPIKFDGDKYYFAWSSRPYDFYLVQEYLPKGERFEDYLHMFTISVMFYGDSPMNSAKAVEYKIAELEEIKKNDPICNYNILENNGAYLLDFIVSKKDDKGNLEFVEVDIHYYRDMSFVGNKASCLLFFSRRAYGDDIMPFLKSLPALRKKWHHNITTLDITPKFQFK